MPWFRRRSSRSSTASDRRGPITVAVRDPSLAKLVASPRSGLSVGGHRLPEIAEPSETDLQTVSMKRAYPAHRGPSESISTFDALCGDLLDKPRYVGLGGRAAIVLRVAEATRSDLVSIRDALNTGDPMLFLQAHRAGRHGLLRAVVVLADSGVAFDTPLSLAGGDTQEFLAAAYANEAIEVHISHQVQDQLLALEYRADGFRAVVEPVLAALTGLHAPANSEEGDQALAAFLAQIPVPCEGLTNDGAIQLDPIGRADMAVKVTIVL